MLPPVNEIFQPVHPVHPGIVVELINKLCVLETPFGACLARLA